VIVVLWLLDRSVVAVAAAMYNTHYGGSWVKFSSWWLHYYYIWQTMQAGLVNSKFTSVNSSAVQSQLQIFQNLVAIILSLTDYSKFHR